MYLIQNIVDGHVYPIHDQKSDVLRVLEPRLILTINKTGQLEFMIPPMHEYYNTIKKLKSIIRVIEDGELIYEGRAISDESDFYNVKKIVCEGSMGYLIDSIQRPFSHTGNINDFLAFLIDNHNKQVEERKQFLLGTVNVVDDESNIKRESTKLDNTWNTVNTYLISKYGGCLYVKYHDGKKYLNYTYDHGGYNDQKIRFGVNLLDLTKYQDATEIATRLIPYGAEVEYQDENGEVQTKTVDITSVNNGSDYITADQSVVDEYGIITATYQWTDVTEPAVLMEKAKALLTELTNIPDTLTVKALDLNYTGVDIRRFKLGRWTTAESKPHGVKKDMLLAKLDLYLDDPQKGSISLGSTVKTFTAANVSKQVELSNSIKKVGESASSEIRRKVENATSLITGGLGGYVVLDVEDPLTGKKIHPWRILVMNTPDKNTATNVIQLNQNGLGFSTTGINGPYRNAWTIDGNLVADFITSGTMLADRIRGGILEVGGAGLAKDGSITVKNAQGEVIGTWDKTGLHVLLGIIEGSTIKGSSIIGGRINIGNGTFEVDSDGSVIINSGEIHIGNVDITEQYAWLYGFGVSDTVLYSRDSGTSVQIITKDDEYGNGPAVELKKGSNLTRIGYGGVVTGDIYFNDPWTDGMTAIDMFKDLYNRTNSLKQRIEDLEG